MYDELIGRLDKRASELPQEIADRENEAQSHCGPRGKDTAADWMNDVDVLLMKDAAAAITDLQAQLAQERAKVVEWLRSSKRPDWACTIEVELIADAIERGDYVS